MKIQNLAYDVCRCYVNDNSGTLGPELVKLLSGWIRSRRHDLLSDMKSLLFTHSHNREMWRVLRQIEAFFKKNDSFSDRDRCLQAAKDSFKEAELQCKQTNDRLEAFYFDPSSQSEFEDQVSRMQDWILALLGPVTAFIESFPSMIRVTSGASATRSRRKSMPYLKVGKKISSTAACTPYLNALSHFFGYGRPRFDVRVSNRVEFVPKNWKTFRTIACEPVGNLPCQLAFDRYAKLRLRSRGIDLSSQFLNQYLAKEASMRNHLATIDLRAASDTVAYNVVWLAFPADWAKLLTDFRSSHYRLDGDMHRYHKFSSMGNGSTFAIETILFAAACHAVGSKAFSVYGDDIIIETELYDPLSRLLAFLGFDINESKSFTSGPFRESCGQDWFDGVDITPFYLRSENASKSDVCHIVNGLAAICHLEGDLNRFLFKLVKEHQIPLVPFNDDTRSGVFIDAHTAYMAKKIKSRYHQLFVKALSLKTKVRRVADSRTLFLWHLACNKRSRVVEAFESSRVPSDAYKYTHRWVRWLPPTQAVPIHLYWWSESLTAYLAVND